MLFETPQTHEMKIPTADGGALSVEITEGAGPTVVFLPGYMSDKNATKATYLKGQCETWGYRFIRFDYRCIDCSLEDLSSTEAFRQQTISNHVQDAMAVLRQLTDEPSIIVGSSMGGWVGMRLLQEAPEKIAGFVGVAAAPDFTKWETHNNAANREGKPPFFPALLDDGQNNYVLEKPLAFNGPVALLQSQQDDSVPWRTALDIAKTVTTPDVVIHLVKDGDHSLSRPQDLALLWQTVSIMREKIVPASPLP